MFQSGPEMLRAIEARRDRVVLMWIPARSSNPIQRYEIYRGDTPQSFMPIGQTSMGNFTDNTVSPGRMYHYYVVAVDSMGLQAASGAISVSVPF